MPDNTLTDDTKALINLIKLKETNAIGYEADMNDTNDKKRVCIEFNTTKLNEEENSSRIKYFFKSRISANYDMVCFDKFARPFDREVDSKDANLIEENVTITLQYRDKNKTILIHKITGYVE